MFYLFSGNISIFKYHGYIGESLKISKKMDQQPMQPVQMQPQPMMQQAPQMVMAAGFSHKSQQMVCPLCHENIATRVEFRACTKTHIIAGLLCFFCGCCCGCCCPYCEFEIEFIFARINNYFYFQCYRLRWRQRSFSFLPKMQWLHRFT